MTTKIISSTIDGFIFSSPVTTLSITGKGYVDNPQGIAIDAAQGTQAYTVNNGGKVAGEIYLGTGGTVTNAASAHIAGFEDGVFIRNAEGVVANYGVIGVASSGNTSGVYLAGGGALINGDASDTTALISGAYGAFIRNAAGSVNNFGTIEGTGRTGGNACGLYDSGGGQIVNGTSIDTRALIEGSGGVEAKTAAANLYNYGTIRALSGVNGRGVLFADGGRVTNGQLSDKTALIAGYGDGVAIDGAPGTVQNFGKITGAGAGYQGVYLYTGVVANGNISDTSAIISGAYGVRLRGPGIVVNYGTIAGTGGVAVQFYSAGDALAVFGGATFVGAVEGGGGTLDLEQGSGTLSGGIGASASPLAATIDTIQTPFTDFATLDLQAPTGFTLTGAFRDAGTLANYGVVTQTGAVTLADGSILNAAPATWTLDAAITTASGDTGAVTNAGTLAKTTGTGLVRVVADVTSTGLVDAGAGTLEFTGATNSFSGTVSGAGTVEFGGGSDVLNSVTLSASRMVLDTPTATLEGIIALTGDLAVTTPDLIIAAGGAVLGAGGTLVLSDTASNDVHGASATTQLTNDGRIQGAGQLGNGELALDNAAGATIIGDDALGLIINTGFQTLLNAGLIQCAGAGGMALYGPVDNTGTLEAIDYGLLVENAVTGAGEVIIEGGTADFASTFAENVKFSSAGGELELARSQSYTGRIAGFSKTGVSSLDLNDIGFIAGTTKATYSGTTTSGVLTVSDGTHTAKIRLAGDYTASTFTVSSDGAGGTKVIDPPPAAQTHAFIAAMAGFGAGASGSATATPATWDPAASALTLLKGAGA